MTIVKASPSDSELLYLWDLGKNTKEISEQLEYPEYCVVSRLWRLREERRAMKRGDESVTR